MSRARMVMRQMGNPATMAVRWIVVALLVALALTACAGAGTGVSVGRLDARPGGAGVACEPGTHRLRAGAPRKTWMRVTPGAVRGAKALLVVLHGAGQAAVDGLRAFRGGWNARGVVMIAPAARDRTWSALYGPDKDLATVNAALVEGFRRCRIDPRRVGIGGFSDGATYALSLGLANGRLFRSVIALSPGGIVGERREGKPRIFVAHGRRDPILPFTGTRDRLVPGLRSAGYRVTFLSFADGHRPLEPESRIAVRWFLQGR
jgi:phospholipase/carboxylesterase